MSPAAWTVAVVIAAAVAITAIVWATCLWRADSKPENRGRHAVRPEHSHARTGPASGADAEQAATEFIAALKDGTEGEGPEPARHAVDVEARFQAALHAEGLDEAAPVLSAPVAAAGPETPAEAAPLVAAALEPLFPPPPLEVRKRPAVPVITARWEPPVARGDLSSLRDALRAWTPRPAVPQEPEAAPEPVPDWLTTSGVNAFAPVLELGDVGKYVDRVFAPAEKAHSAVVAAELGSEEKGRFLGTSLPGLPDEDWDLTRPVLALPGGTVAGNGTEAGAA